MGLFFQTETIDGGWIVVISSNGSVHLYLRSEWPLLRCCNAELGRRSGDSYGPGMLTNATDLNLQIITVRAQFLTEGTVRW